MRLQIHYLILITGIIYADKKIDFIFQRLIFVLKSAIKNIHKINNWLNFTMNFLIKFKEVRLKISKWDQNEKKDAPSFSEKYKDILETDKLSLVNIVTVYIHIKE